MHLLHRKGTRRGSRHGFAARFADAAPRGVAAKYGCSFIAEAEDNAGDRDVGAADSGDGATGGQGVQADELADAAVRASRLLARAAAAKEAGGQAIAPPPEAANVDASVTAVHSLIHLRHKSYKSAHTHGVEGDIDDMRIEKSASIMSCIC